MRGWVSKGRVAVIAIGVLAVAAAVISGYALSLQRSGSIPSGWGAYDPYYYYYTTTATYYYTTIRQQ